MLDEQSVAHLERAQPVGRPRGAAVEAGGEIGLDAGLPNRMERGMVEQLVFHMRGKIDAHAPGFPRTRRTFSAACTGARIGTIATPFSRAAYGAQ